MKILSVIQQYFFYQQKIKADTEKLKYYLIINNKVEANKIIDEILNSKEKVNQILKLNIKI